MKRILGVIIFIIGIVLTAYVGVWLMFIGGIVDAVNLFKGVMVLTGMNVAITICKILFSELAWIIFVICSFISKLLFEE